MANDQELVKLAKSGNEAAFEQLVGLYEQKVYHLAYNYMNNEQDALDISQEVFLRVFRFLSQFNEESQFSTWLYRIAANACKDALRKRQVRNEVFLYNEDEETGGYRAEPADLTYNPEAVLEQAELRENLKRGLLELPAQHRQILVLRDIAGLSYNEIGNCLALEQGTVKSRIARARENLRGILIALGNNPPKSQSKPVEGRSPDAQV